MVGHSLVNLFLALELVGLFILHLDKVAPVVEIMLDHLLFKLVILLETVLDLLDCIIFFLVLVLFKFIGLLQTFG